MGDLAASVTTAFLILLCVGCTSAETRASKPAQATMMFDQWGRLTATGAGTTGKPPIDPQYEYRGHRGKTTE